MTGLRALLTLAIVPLLVLDLCAGLIGGIWLARDGAWTTIVTGFAATFIAVSVTSAIPLYLLGAEGEGERGNVAAAVRSAILLGIMGMWAVAMFAILMARAGEASALAAALWSYATATGAWTMLAQRMAHERSGAGPPALFNQIGCLGLMFYALTDADPAWPDMALWYGAPAFTCLAAQILFAVGARTRLP